MKIDAFLIIFIDKFANMDSGRIMKELRELQDGVKNVSAQNCIYPGSTLFCDHDKIRFQKERHS
jgi:hypothetical protein